LHQTFIEKAPVVIVVCADVARSSWGYGYRGANLYCLQDTAAATENILWLLKLWDSQPVGWEHFTRMKLQR